MLNKISASTKLYLLVLVMSIFIIGIGGYGIYELKNLNRSNQTLFTDRVVPMAQLSAVRHSFAMGILAAIQRVKAGQISYLEASNQITEVQKNLNTYWRSYKQTYLTNEETQLANEADERLIKANQTMENLKGVLKKEDIVVLDQFIIGELYPAINPTIGKINDLIQLQIKVGGEEYKKSQKGYYKAAIRFYLLIALSLIFAGLFSSLIVRNIKELILNLEGSNNKLAEIGGKYRSLVDQAGDSIFLLNEDMSISEVNHSASKLLGYEHDEFLALKISDIIDPEEKSRVSIPFTTPVNQKTEISEQRWLKKDGTRVDMEVNARLLEGNRYLAIARDITERKRSEEAIRESERKYRDIFENIQDVSYQTSFSGTILNMSPSVINHLGYKRDEIIGTSVYHLYAQPADREKVLELLLQHGVLKDYEVRFKSSSGALVYTTLNARLVRDEDGAPNYVDGMFRNISERKRMESLLIEQKEQLTLFIEHSPASLAMFDKEMRYLATSKRWISDYNLSGKQLIGKTHYEIFPEINQEWKDIHARSLNGSVEKKEEDSFIRADGSKEWLKWEIHPWHKANGEIGGIIMLTEVITERKRATEWFKYQFENSPDIILLINKFHLIEAINRGIPDGKPVDDFIGMDCISIFSEQSQDEVISAINACFESGQNQEIENAKWHDSWVNARFVPIHTDGLVSHVMVFSTDNTKRKLIEEQLKQSEEKHRALTDNISDAIILINANAEIVYRSPSVERITGYVEEDINNKKVFDFVHPEDIPIALHEFQKAIISPGVPVQNNFRIKNKSGNYIWIEGTIINLLENIGVKGFILNYRDITERKNAEAEINSLNESLEQRVKDRTTELVEANKALEAFSYSVTHDLRAPLRAIIGFTSIIKNEYAAGFNDDLNDLFERISSSGKRMSAIIEDLLRVAKYEKMQLHFEEVDMEELVRNVWGNHKFSSPHRATLHLATLPITRLDGSLVEQVMVNLISNAVKYSSKKEQPEVTIGYEDKPGSITFFVQDNGVGFDMQFYDRLFGAFQRLHSLYDFEGTGVGLLLVKRIIERHGGEVWAEGKVDEGATFYFSIPKPENLEVVP